MIYKILLIGPQASGKGTQAQILSEKFDLPIFSTGNILRQKISQGDELGRQVEALVNQGQLVPDEMVNKIVKEKITEQAPKGYILDGYPRNLSQAKFLDSYERLTYIFEIEISDKEAVKRISGRRTCPECQTVYHIQTNPPQKKDVCDKDGSRLVVRGDEQAEVVKERLRNYHKKTKPVLEWYKESGIYYKINGEQPIESVSQDIFKILED